MGSDSDLPVIQKATDVLKGLGIPYEAHVYSAHRTPEEARAFAVQARGNGFGVLMAATIGVPVYMCGGGTIPLLIEWLADGMSMGSAAAFMITGPATKITNLGALKIAMGWKRFALYLVFVMAFALGCGLVC